MAHQFVIRPAPNQDFGKFVRRVVSLAEGARVETDTSARPYFVRVNEATYRRWVASLPGKRAAAVPAAEQPPAPTLTPAAPADSPPTPAAAAPVQQPPAPRLELTPLDVAAQPAPRPDPVTQVTEAAPRPDPVTEPGATPVKKAAKRTSARRRTTGGGKSKTTRAQGSE